MSYKIDVSFKNCKPSEVYKRLEEFSSLVAKNARELILQDIWFLEEDKLKGLYEKTKNAWEVKEKIRKWLQELLRFHIYYNKKINAICIVYGGEVKEINAWFDGSVYFQNSCDQDYDYEIWSFNKKFCSYVDKIKNMDNKKFINYYSRNCHKIYKDDINSIDDIDYYKRSCVYDMCYKEIEPIWESDVNVSVGNGLFGEYIELTNYIIRILCGLVENKREEFIKCDFWKKVFKLEVSF